LVDMSSQSEIGSYELKGDSEAGYILQIDIKQTAPVLASTAKKPEAKKETQPESTKEVTQTLEKPAAKDAPQTIANDDAAHLSKSKKRLSLDKQAYEAGLAQLRQGNFIDAEKSLIEALKVNPEYVRARIQLITALQQQNKIEQAQAQMREGLVQTPRSLQLRKMYARFLLSQKYSSEAIEVLRAKPFPTIAQDPEYHALLAALFQETKQFEAAAQVYAGLLQLRPETALWWFGLAVSMDQAGDYDQARNAYRRALTLPGLSADVQKYVQDRLQVL
jgi:MSHA biogenesis protein MshN